MRILFSLSFFQQHVTYQSNRAAETNKAQFHEVSDELQKPAFRPWKIKRVLLFQLSQISSFCRAFCLVKSTANGLRQLLCWACPPVVEKEDPWPLFHHVVVNGGNVNTSFS